MLNDIFLKISARHANAKCLIIGDFNINLLRIDRGKLPIEYITTMYSFGYTPLIMRPTRVTSRSVTLIDHIWTNDAGLVSGRGILRCGITDHFPIFVSLHIDNPIETSKMVYYSERVHTEATEAKFTSSLLEVDWEGIKNIEDVEQMYGCLVTAISSKFNECFPIVEKKRKILGFNKPYITYDIKILIKKTDLTKIIL